MTEERAYCCLNCTASANCCGTCGECPAGCEDCGDTSDYCFANAYFDGSDFYKDMGGNVISSSELTTECEFLVGQNNSRQTTTVTSLRKELWRIIYGFSLAGVDYEDCVTMGSGGASFSERVLGIDELPIIINGGGFYFDSGSLTCSGEPNGSNNWDMGYIDCKTGELTCIRGFNNDSDNCQTPRSCSIYPNLNIGNKCINERVECVNEECTQINFNLCTSANGLEVYNATHYFIGKLKLYNNKGEDVGNIIGAGYDPCNGTALWNAPSCHFFAA
jgi:hypothetical protein